MESLSSNIDSQTIFFHPHWVLNNTTVLFCYQPLDTQVFWYFFHATILDSHYVSVCCSEISL